MEWQILLTVYLTLFISSPLIAILHELGHALAYLSLTRPDHIDIYIGSYGDQTNSAKFDVGKLTFHIKKSFPFVRGIGLCVSSKRETNYLNLIIILLAGTLFTLVTAGLVTLLVLHTHADIMIKVSCYIFLGLSAVSLIINLVPYKLNTIRDFNTTPISLESDGRQILFTLKIKNQLPLYCQAQNDVKERRYEDAINKFKDILTTAPNTERILRQAITLSLQNRSFADAEKFIDQLEEKTEPTVPDLLNRGCCSL